MLGGFNDWPDVHGPPPAGHGAHRMPPPRFGMDGPGDGWHGDGGHSRGMGPSGAGPRYGYRNDGWHGGDRDRGGNFRGPDRRDGPVDSPRSPDSNQIWQLFRSLVPPEDDKIRRDELVARVRSIVRRHWTEAELHQYGSTANDLCLRHADIDLCLTLPKNLDTPVDVILEELGVLLERCKPAP